MNIYEIEIEMQRVFAEAIDEETGEILDESLLDKLDELGMERDQKIENAACLYKNLVAEAEALKAEKMSLADRQSKKEKQAEKLLAYIERATAGEKFETARCKVGYRKSTTVEVDEIAMLTDEYLKYEAPKADKTKIKKALTSGVEVPGAHLEEHRNISIK